MPTRPEHQGWLAIQAMISSASSCSCFWNSWRRMPSESPEPTATDSEATPTETNEPEVQVDDDFDVIENGSYYTLLKLYKSGISQAAIFEFIHARRPEDGLRLALQQRLLVQIAPHDRIAGRNLRGRKRRRPCCRATRTESSRPSASRSCLPTAS